MFCHVKTKCILIYSHYVLCNKVVSKPTRTTKLPITPYSVNLTSVSDVSTYAATSVATAIVPNCLALLYRLVLLHNSSEYLNKCSENDGFEISFLPFGLKRIMRQATISPVSKLV